MFGFFEASFGAKAKAMSDAEEDILPPCSLRVLRVETSEGKLVPFLAVEANQEGSLENNLIHFSEDAHSYLAGRSFYCFKLNKSELERLAYYALVVVGQLQPD